MSDEFETPRSHVPQQLGPDVLAHLFHSFRFQEHGIDLHGIKPVEQLEAEAAVILDFDLREKTLIDIGCWDGWYTFEAERRGAKVTGCDHFCWSGPGWGTRAGFDYVRKQINSNATAIDCDVPDLRPDLHGTYDAVLLLGVIYHCKDPFAVLERAAALAKETMVVETQTMPGTEPIARYWLGDSLNGDPTNYWTPTVACLRDMLREVGFTKFVTSETPLQPQTAEVTRHIVRATR
ncbi:MAG: DUF1698 domain-containing protein [Pseudomonadota bacterium]